MLPDDEALDALSPLDGRYARETGPLRSFFSEAAFLRQRVRVEIEYLLALSSDARLVRSLSDSEQALLRSLASDFSTEDARAVKSIEQTTRHDVKAIEYFLRDRLRATPLSDVTEWLHFGLTSEDVNQTAQALSLRESRDAVLLPALGNLLDRLALIAHQHAQTPMLARTHGQPAVPTTLGKELVVFWVRLDRQIALMRDHRFEAKLTGAVGNFNALTTAIPHVDWPAFSERFIRSLGLEPNLFTTQLLPYDNWVRYFDTLRLTNSILIDLAQAIWRYISDDYLRSRAVKGEVGSSTMPHKVNPIDFENAEGNLGIAISLLTHYATKLPITRLQRDLSDSTVRRTFGAALGHAFVSYVNLARGLERIEANEVALRLDLEAHWEVVAEGAQTILRAAGVPHAYETLMDLSRGKGLSKAGYAEWVETLAVDETVKTQLRRLTPLSYLGLAEQLVTRALARDQGSD